MTYDSDANANHHCNTVFKEAMANLTTPYSTSAYAWTSFLASTVGLPVSLCSTIAAGHLINRDFTVRSLSRQAGRMDDKPPGPSGGVFKPPSIKSAQQNMRKRALMASTLNAHSAFDQIPEDVQASTGELSLDNPTEQQQAARSSRRSIEQRSWRDYWDSKQQVDIEGR